MKAIVLAAGRGRRLGDMLGNRNKCMIPVNRRPVIEYSFGSVANTEVKEMIVVVGFRAEEIINTYGNNYKGVRIKYVVQQEQKGLVHALECSAAMLDGDDFILLLGDEVLVNPRHQKLISEFRGDSAIALCGVLKVEDRSFIKRTYSILHDEKNKVYRLIEFTPAHHERKEKELPDLIQCAIDDGKLVRSFTICDRYTNINTPEDVTLAESFFNESGCYI